MTHPVDLQADALLLVLTEQHGGDLHAAFALLCARVTPDDIIGEPFEAALTRAVRTLFAKPIPARVRLSTPAIDPGRSNV